MHFAVKDLAVTAIGLTGSIAAMACSLVAQSAPTVENGAKIVGSGGLLVGICTLLLALKPWVIDYYKEKAADKEREEAARAAQWKREEDAKQAAWDRQQQEIAAKEARHNLANEVGILKNELQIEKIKNEQLRKQLAKTGKTASEAKAATTQIKSQLSGSALFPSETTTDAIPPSDEPPPEPGVFL